MCSDSAPIKSTQKNSEFERTKNQLLNNNLSTYTEEEIFQMKEYHWMRYSGTSTAASKHGLGRSREV